MPSANTPLLVMLPALNEAANIARTICAIRQQLPQADIVVIDDGSSDETGTEAHHAGAIVLRMPYNVGIGAAVQTGFRFAAKHGYAFVLRNDGDGQHHPAALQRMMSRVQEGDVDMVIGSRFLQNGDYGTSLPRRAGIIILSRLLSFITKQSITDPTSGYAAFNRNAILLFAQLYPHDYPEPEAIVLLHRSGLKLCEIPVTMQARQYGKSSITPVRSAYYMVKVILAILINLLRRAPVIQHQ